MSNGSFIEMSVGGLTLDPVTKTPVVILRDVDNKLNLPIWIGLSEASSMASELEGIRVGRPMTHDLLQQVIEELGGQVERIEVTNLRENTFYAVICLRGADREHEIDARPSDAISLALRTKCPIFVAESVLESSAEVVIPAEDMSAADLSNVSPDQWLEILKQMGPDDFKYRM